MRINNSFKITAHNIFRVHVTGMASYTVQTRNGSQGIHITNVSENGKPISREQVKVKFSREFNRKTDDWIEDAINSTWLQKCKTNNRLYNQSKFRLGGIYKSDSETTINLGLTTYKDLMGTNCHPLGQKMMIFGKDHFDKSQSYLSDALGVGSLLLTADKKFLFMKRALWTAEDHGKLDRPGGHPEPDNIPNINSWTEDDYGKVENSLQILNEVFDSVKNEIRDEVNIPIETLNDPLLLGVTRSLERFGRPSAEFLVVSSLDSKEMEALYSKGSQSEADESLGIIFLSEESVRNKDLEPSIWLSLTDACCGAIELYSRCYTNYPEIHPSQAL